MNTTVACTRQEHLANLPAFIAGLARYLDGQGATQGANAGGCLLSTAVQAHCVQCGIGVTGAELMALLGESKGDARSSKVERLGKGYCARNGCTSYYYRVEFADVPSVNWSETIARAEMLPVLAQTEATATRPLTSYLADFLVPKHALSLTGLVATLVVFWLARQYYVGGTIPLLREPERFEVDSFAVEKP